MTAKELDDALMEAIKLKFPPIFTDEELEELGISLGKACFQIEEAQRRAAWARLETNLNGGPCWKGPGD